MKRMTVRRALGILRRRRDYLLEVIEGKHAENMRHRHEDQEVEALSVAIDLLTERGT